MGRSFETGLHEAASLHRLAELVGRPRENLSAPHGEPSARVAQLPGGDDDALSALDVWWASFAAMIVPLPPELCPMRPDIRAAYAVRDPAVRAATDPALLEHRDFIYREHLEVPVRL